MPVIFASYNSASPIPAGIFGPGAKPVPIPKAPDLNRLNEIRQRLVATYGFIQATRAVYNAVQDDTLNEEQKLQKVVTSLGTYVSPRNLFYGLDDKELRRLVGVEDTKVGIAKFFAGIFTPPPVTQQYLDPPEPGTRAIFARFG